MPGRAAGASGVLPGKIPEVAALGAAVNKLNEGLVQTVGLLKEPAAALIESQRQTAQTRTETDPGVSK